MPLVMIAGVDDELQLGEEAEMGFNMRSESKDNNK